jgi:hypothetical protein
MVLRRTGSLRKCRPYRNSGSAVQGASITCNDHNPRRTQSVHKGTTLPVQRLQSVTAEVSLAHTELRMALPYGVRYGDLSLAAFALRVHSPANEANALRPHAQRAPISLSLDFHVIWRERPAPSQRVPALEAPYHVFRWVSRTKTEKMRKNCIRLIGRLDEALPYSHAICMKAASETVKKRELNCCQDRANDRHLKGIFTLRNGTNKR